MSPLGDHERWFAGRQIHDETHRPRSYVVRLRGQPENGFETVGDVMDWLTEQGLLVVEEDHLDGKIYVDGKGWGDPYCGVAGSRNDPWEST